MKDLWLISYSRVILQCSVFNISWKSCLVFFFIIDSLAPISERDQNSSAVNKSMERTAELLEHSRRLRSRCSCFKPLSSSDTNVFICFMSIPWRFYQITTRGNSESGFSYFHHLCFSHWCGWLIFTHSHHMQSAGSWLSDWESWRHWRNAHSWFHWRPKRHAGWDVSPEHVMKSFSNPSSRPTLSWEFSMTFRLLSEDVTSGPNSTHPARKCYDETTHQIQILPSQLSEQGKQWSRWSGSKNRHRFPPEQPPPAALIHTTFDSEYIIHESFINHLRAQRRDKVHICKENHSVSEQRKKIQSERRIQDPSPLSMRKTFPISAWRGLWSPSSTCSLQDSYAI